MDRRVIALAGLLASGLICAAAESFAAATHCNPDYVYTWNTVQSAASNVRAPAQPKAETPASTSGSTSSANASANASGGGDDAGNVSDGGGNLHKRGLRWQSFLPGMIK